MAEGKIPGLGDVVKTVANLALYQQRVAEGKTSDGVIYLVLAERKVFFNGEDWTEGGGKIEYRTFLTGAVNNAGKAENLASLNAFLEGKALLYYPYAEGGVTHNLSLVEYIVVDGAYVFRFDYEDTTLNQILVEVNADGTASEDILIVEKIFDPKLSGTSTNAPQTKVVYEALQGKQDTLVDGVTIKTVNGQSILGEGNLEIQGGGGTGGSVDSESEEVIAAAFNDMNKRMDADKASFATKKALAQEVANLVSEIEQREEVTAAALADLDTRLVASRDYLEQNYITSEGFAEYMANLTAEIQDNERVIAAALTDINARLSALMND